MYNASELFIIKDVLEIYNNECMFITTCLESRAADDHKVKKFTEFLPCAFTMYDCRQLEDVSSVENVHMVIQISYLGFLSGASTSIFHHATGIWYTLAQGTT